MRPAGHKVAFPRYAYYNIPIKYALETGAGVTCLLQPQITRRTLEIGAKYSPDYVCSPFKVTLGSMIEALEAGADTLIMVYGLCKLSYYGELQQQILHDLGYEFSFVNLEEYTTGKLKDYLKALKIITPKVHYGKFIRALLEAVKMVEYIDTVTAIYYENCGFETEKGAYRKVFDDFLRRLESVKSRKQIEEVYHNTCAAMNAIPLNKPARPLRVGIVGEFYTAMDPFANDHVEQHLADMGVEVHRWMNVTNRLLHYPGEKNLHVKIQDLCTYEMGPTSTANIWAAKKYAEDGYDGIIHIKGSSCTPEIDIMPVLQNIGRDYKIPILYLTFDAQTSDVGVMTRLEAFYDMIETRVRRVQDRR